MFSVTYYGYASLLLHFEKLILTDPGILQGKPLVETSAVCASFILVTHTHPENLGNTVDHAIDNGTMVIGNPQVIEKVQCQGAPGYYLETLRDGEVYDTKANVTIRAHELRHSGFLAPHNTAFLITSSQGSVLHLGHAKEYDTLRNSHPDLLCVPVAGKKKGTLDPGNAADATVAIQPRYVLPICGDTTQNNNFSSLLSKLSSSVKPIDPETGKTYNIR